MTISLRVMLLVAFIACSFASASSAKEVHYRGSMDLVTYHKTGRGSGGGDCQARRISLRVDGSTIIYRINKEDFKAPLNQDGTFHIKDRRVIKGNSGHIWEFEITGRVADGIASGDYSTGGDTKCFYKFSVPKE